MIYTITWALLSTAGAVAVYLLMHAAVRDARREIVAQVAQGREWRDKAWDYHREAGQAKLAKEYAEESLKRHMSIFADASDRLRAIEQQRSETTRKGNATRKARRDALVAQTAAKLQAETSEQAMAA